ncbi:hypothetical protein [Streptomyces globisporus]|uniref:hypothetical protein n=1 Tax=Streptomyces globisporus TaxID=1908 RepID=UPI0007C566D2|nr:hypothetical protein [Streptomyces globisporus]
MVALLLVGRDDAHGTAVHVREARLDEPDRPGVDQLRVVGEPRYLRLDQPQQADVAEPVGAQEGADRHPVAGEPPSELDGLGRGRDLCCFRAVFEHSQERGDVPGRLLGRESGDVLVPPQLGELAAGEPQHGVDRLVRPRPELLSQTAEEGVDIGPHTGIVRKPAGICHRVGEGGRLRPRGD